MKPEYFFPLITFKRQDSVTKNTFPKVDLQKQKCPFERVRNKGLAAPTAALGLDGNFALNKKLSSLTSHEFS